MPGKGWGILSEKKIRETLIVFLRAPEPGRVKTRLARDVGSEKALSLYKAFAAAVLAAADAWQRQPRPPAREVCLSYYPKDKVELMHHWLGRGRTYLPQSGSTLGRRMANAMSAAFDAGADRCVLVGTDLPELTRGHLDRAFAGLDGADVVLGPSLDGGYWLIGARRQTFSPAVFQDIDWGTQTVFTATLDRCQENGLRWKALSPLRDVDTLADLEAVRLNTGHPF